MKERQLQKIIGLSALLLLIASINSIGFHQSDEHFQILEFAAMRAGHTPASELPWEYAEQMRPGLQPLMAYAVLKSIGNPFWTAWLLRLLTAAFCLTVSYLVFQRYRSTLRLPQAIKLFAGLCFLHWIMLYSGGRFASESWSGLCLALGFLCYPLKRSPDTSLQRGHQATKAAAIRYVLIGLLFGLAFAFRYQVAIAVLGFGAWLVFMARERWWRIGLLILGGLLALLLGTLADYWLYGEWVNAPWNYLEQNLVEGKAATFGTMPWWGYFELVLLRGIPPLSLLYIVLPLIFFWQFRRDPISWVWLPFLLVHCYLGRKDIRFLWPLLPLFPVVAMWSLQWVRERYGDFWKWRSWRVLFGLCLLINGGALLINSLRPMRASLSAAHYIYYEAESPTTIIVPEGRPYIFFDLPAYFYRPTNLQLADTCPEEGRCLYLFYARQPVAPPGTELIWTNRPVWLPNFKQKWYYIYE
ncbi:MAG: hypothetical protein AAF433_20310 [Bacteroidota bacterium]